MKKCLFLILQDDHEYFQNESSNEIADEENPFVEKIFQKTETDEEEEETGVPSPTNNATDVQTENTFVAVGEDFELNVSYSKIINLIS